MKFFKWLIGKIWQDLEDVKTQTSNVLEKVFIPSPVEPLAISLNATAYDDEPPKTWDTLLAPGWVLEGSFTMWDIATFIREQKAKFPNARLFGVLEDVGQAFYTSGHCLGYNELDDIDPETQTGLHPGSFELIREGEPPEFVGLSHASEFPIRHKIFMDFVAGFSPTEWHNEMTWRDGSPGCPVLLKGSQPRPDVEGWEWTRDSSSYVMRVPVKTAAEAIAIFPNGYFDDDMGPKQNYALAKALEEKFGLEIFGLGATYAGYMRDAPLTAAEAETFGDFLKPLYSSEPAGVGQRIADIIVGENIVFLAYGNRE